MIDVDYSIVPDFLCKWYRDLLKLTYDVLEKAPKDGLNPILEKEVNGIYDYLPEITIRDFKLLEGMAYILENTKPNQYHYNTSFAIHTIQIIRMPIEVEKWTRGYDIMNEQIKDLICERYRKFLLVSNEYIEKCTSSRNICVFEEEVNGIYDYYDKLNARDVAILIKLTESLEDINHGCYVPKYTMANMTEFAIACIENIHEMVELRYNYDKKFYRRVI